MAKKSDKKAKDEVTKDGAVTLDEGELDQAAGGGDYLKIGDIDGESLNLQTSTSLDPKLTTDTYKLTTFDKTFKR